MSNDPQRFLHLMEKYRENDLTAKEYDEFLQLLKGTDIEAAVNRITSEEWKASGEILSRLRKKEKAYTQSRNIRLYIGAAASILLLLSVYFFWLQPQPDNSQTVYQTGYGESKSFSLPDGSTVLLNANSKLIWENNWARRNYRSAKLSGEAFFEVKRADQMTFQVQAGAVDIKVLGTEFNVRNRRGAVNVFLSNGSIDLEIEGSEEPAIRMQPGNLVSYEPKDGGSVIKDSSTLMGSASWIQGMLSFENEHLKEILQNFEELYGKHFQVGDQELLQKRLDLSLPYSNWDLIKEALEVSLQVEFTERQDTILVH